MSSKQEDLRFIRAWVKERSAGTSVVRNASRDVLEPVAITGLSGYFPGCMDVASFWKRIDRDQSLISEIPQSRFNWETYYDPAGEAQGSMRTKWGGFIPNIAAFDPEFFNILPLEAREMDPRQRLLLMSAWRTLEDAGYDPDRLKRSDTGVFIGCEANEYAQLMRAHGVQSRALFNEADSLIANRISYYFDFAGPSEFVNTMCSSFAVALNRAVIALRSGRIHRAIVGAANIMLLPDTFVALSQGNQLCGRDSVRSFGKEADGYLRSEGVGTILIERLSDAEAANRPVYAIVKHTAVNYNGHGGVSMAAPDAAAHSELIKSCYREAGIDPQMLTYIEAQGMGLPVADIAEWGALNRALTELCRERGAEPAPGYCRVSTLKPLAGHMHAASSLAALLKIIRSFQTNKAHKVLDFAEPNEFCDMDRSPCRILTSTESWIAGPYPRLAALHSYGSGGNNAHILLEESRDQKKVIRTGNAEPVLVCLSARTERQLKRQIENLHNYLAAERDIDLLNLSFTLLAGRKSFDYRCAIVAESLSHLISSLEGFEYGQMRHPSYSGRKAGGKLIDLADRAACADHAGLAGAWVEGASVENIGALYGDQRVRRLSGLPGYPFDETHYWFEEPGKDKRSPQIATDVHSPSSPGAVLPHTGYASEDVQRRLLSVIQSSLGIEADRPILQTPFLELGLNSIAVPLFVATLQDEFGIKLRQSDIYSYPTPERMAERIMSALGHTALSKPGVRENSVDSAAEVRRRGSLPDDIAIIGISLRVAGARDHHEFWSNLKEGRCSIDEIPESRRSSGFENLKTRKGGFIADVDRFDPLFFNIAPREARHMDPRHRLLLEAAYAAIEDSGYCPLSWKGGKHGIFVGIEESDYPVTENSTITSVHGGTAPARIGYYLDTRGPLLSLGTACSSSLVAIHYACKSLLAGESEWALAGGCNIASNPGRMLSNLARMGDMLSPDGICYAFDERANGMVVGEGVGLVVLKRLADARRDRDAIYGVIKATGINYDGRTNGLTAPSGLRQRELYERVSRESGVHPRQISYVVAHGTGTSLGDPVECNALIDAFEPAVDAKRFCALTSPKTNIGHTLAASGVVNLITAVLALTHRQIPPSLNYVTGNHDIRFEDSPFYVNTSLRRWDQEARYTAVSSFGHSGTNAHAILGNAPESAIVRSGVRTGQLSLFVLSARTEERLRTYARKLADYLDGHAAIDLERFCYTIQTGREAMRERIALVCGDCELLAETLRAYADGAAANVLSGSGKPSGRSDMRPRGSGHTGIADSIRVRDWQTLAAQWVAGADIPWERLYPSGSMQRLFGLPTYPFSRESYWVESAGSTQRDDTTRDLLTRLHPLVHKNTSDFSEHRFTSVFSGAEFFLADHVVMGQRVLPGVACLEMARAAFARLAARFGDKHPAVRLQNFVWARPLHVGEAGRRVDIGFRRKEDGRFQFEICEGTEEPGNPTDAAGLRYCQGVASFEGLRDARRLDIASLKESLHQKAMTSAECYAAFEATGVKYGPSHRGVQAIYAGKDQVLAELVLPSSLKGTLDEFVLHPSLMDAALQACIGISGIALDARPLLPFALDDIEIRGACSAEMWAWVRPSLNSGNPESLQKLDIDLSDEEGNVRIRLGGLSLRLREAEYTARSGRGNLSLHPLIHRKLTSGASLRFISLFSGNETLLAEHLQILPAAACLEMARAAGSLAASGDVTAVKQIVWADPLEVRGAGCEVTTSLNPSGDHYSFEISTAAAAGIKRVHCQGKLTLVPNGCNTGIDLGLFDIEEVRSRCPSVLTAADCSQLLQGSHGPSLMTIENLRHGDDEALAQLRLPDVIDPGETACELHPGILNGAILSSVLLTLANDPTVGLPMPFSLEELRICGDTSGVAYAHVKRSPGRAEFRSGRLKHDVDLADPQGKVLVSFVGLTTVAMQSRADMGILYARPCWVEEALSEAKSSDLWRPLPHFVLVKENASLRAALKERWPGVQVDVLHQAGKTNAGAIVSNFLQVFHGIRAWIENKFRARQIMMVLVPESEDAHIHAALSGLLRTAQLESSKISGKLIRYPHQNGDIAGFLVRCLEDELNDAGGAIEVRYDWGRRREVKKYREIDRQRPDQSAGPAFAPGDVVWITGGLGRLGHLFARHLGNKGIKIVLTGRSALDVTRSEVLACLRADGADAEYFPCDVSQADQVMSLVQSILDRHGKLTAVVHCAGVIRDSFIHRKTADEIRSVFAPKVGGILAIHHAVRNVDLKFLVLFSAAAGAFGNPGQADYAGANAFLDGFAEYRNGLVDRKVCYGRTVSLSWPLWRDGGMQLDRQTQELMTQTTGMIALETEHGTQAFDFALSSREHTQILVAAGNVESIREKLLNSGGAGTRESDSGNSSQDTSGKDSNTDVFLLEALQKTLIDLVAEQQQIAPCRIELASELSQYGFDSIGFTELATRLNAHYGLELMPTVFFEYTSLSALAGYLADKYSSRLTEKHKSSREGSALPENAARVKEVEEPGSEIEPPNAIAIIGMSGRFPGAANLQEYWKHLEANRDLISEIPKERWDWRDFYGNPREESGKTNVKWAGLLEGVDLFDPLFFGISPREAELMDPQLRLLLETVWAAIEDAGYPASRLAGSSTGVFVGASSTDYKELWQKADLEAGIQEGAMIYHFMLANRISYVFNLHGPSESIDTACSSSLVALHRAVESIRQGSCEMALVGGVNVIVNPYLVIAASKAGMLSEDGRCRTFDKSASGYGRGEGAGVILLKPLERAIADRDQIHGVIRGSAENHGGKATSPTAPNPSAQQDLLFAAYEDAGVDPRTITYIEAHGTGTELGDPIEVDALKRAFAALYDKRGLVANGEPHCALGSVKANIGHLEAAAGISGVLKILLMMRYRKIPGNAHLKEQNPYINLGGSPFYLVRDTQQWEVKPVEQHLPAKRRAGVSSFGIGGSNAHVIIEEFTSVDGVDFKSHNPAAGAFVIVPLSAKNPERLKESATRLLSFLESNRQDPGPELEDIAYTLQTGREPMEERLGLVVDSIDDLQEKLRRFLDGVEDAEGLRRGRSERRGADALAADEDMSAITDGWMRKAQHGKLVAMWVKGLPLDWDKLYVATKPRRISLPTYPFARERYWIPAMASKAAEPRVSAALLHPLLHVNTSDLSEQRFSSRFSGEEFFLADHVVRGQRILPGVAYLEMVRAAVEQSRVKPRSAGFPGQDDPAIKFENVVWARPIEVGSRPVEVHAGLYPGEGDKLHYEVYTVRAQVAGNSQAQASDDPAVVHSEGTVSLMTPDVIPQIDLTRFRNECAQTYLRSEQFYETFHQMGLDYGPSHRGIKEAFVGPSQVLARLSLPLSVADTANRFVMHPSLLDSALQASIALTLDSRDLRLPFALESLEIHKRCPSPSWAVIRWRDPEARSGLQTLDIDLCDDDGSVCVRMVGVSSRILERKPAKTVTTVDTATTILRPQWKTLKPRNIPARLNEAERFVVLCDFEPGIRQYLEERLHGVRLIEWRAEGASIEERFVTYATRAFEEIRAILERRPRGIIFIQVVLAGGGERGKEQRVFSALSAVLRTAQLENPAIVPQLIEVEAGVSGHTLSDLLSVNAENPEHAHIRYLNDQRLTHGWEQLPAAPESERLPWKDGGVYLITGGAGGLGLLFAEEIALKCWRPVLILAGRSVLSPERRDQISVIEATGARVQYRQVDVRSKGAVESLIAEITREHGRLDGIIHAAGINRDNFIIRKTREEFQDVLAPKVNGLASLDLASASLPLDFFICFSSAAGALGNAGQSDYAAGNAFMDAFMEVRSARVAAGERYGRSLSINWPFWKDGGMRIDPAKAEALEQEMGLLPMATVPGMRAFYSALASGEPQVLVLEGDSRRLNAFVARTVLAADRERETAGGPARAGGDQNTGATGDDLKDKALHYFKNLLSSTLKLPLDHISAEEPLETYGLDSIMVMQLTNRLEKSFGSLSRTLFFEYQTIREVTGYFLESHRKGLDAILNGSDSRGWSQPGSSTAAIVPERHEQQTAVKTRRERFQLPFVPEPRRPLLQDIAIIGLSGRYPQARDLDAYWANLRDGKDCITEIPKDRWDWKDYYGANGNGTGSHASKWGGFIDDVDKFDPLFFNISPREAELIDPQERLFLEHAWAALEDAGYCRDSLPGHSSEDLPSQVGVYAGVMYGEYQLLGAELSARGNRVGFASTLASIANRVSYVLNLHGPSMTVDTMCSSSLTSIHLACQDLKLGRTDMAIAGGVNITIHPNKYLILTSGRFLSKSGRCESFGEGGDGYIPSEGVGVVVLKRLDEARRDRDHIYGVIKGSAINHGGRTNGYSVPNPNAQQMVVARALKEARLDPRAVSYIEAHGTGTKLGDPIEITGLTKAFGKSAAQSRSCWIGSAKSNIGHCESAAGIAGLTKVLLQMQHGQIAPSLHSESLNPDIAFEETGFVVNHDLRSWNRPVVDGVAQPRIAGISSFGAGGSNAHLIVEEFQEEPESRRDLSAFYQPDRAHCIVISAKTEDRLREIAARLHQFVLAHESFELADFAYTLQVGREPMEVRLGFTAKTKDELKRKLSAVLADEDAEHDIYRGTVRRNREALEVIAGDDDMTRAVEAWIEKGKYARLMNLWVKGLSVDWSRIYGESKPRRLSLPAYPFVRERYWAPARGNVEGEATPELARRELHYLQKCWKSQSLLPARTSSRAVAILANEETRGLADALSQKFDRRRIILLDSDVPAIEPGTYWKDLDGCIDVVGCGRTRADNLKHVAWLQRLIEHGRRDELMLLGVTRGLESFRNASINLAGASRAGLYRMLQSEYSGLRSRHMDLDPESAAAEVMEQIAAEFRIDDSACEVCYRGGARFEALLSARAGSGESAQKLVFPEDQVLWITGGTRGLGALCARHFASRYGVKRFVLTGKDEFPPRSSWPSYVTEASPIGEKIRAILGLEEQGVEVRAIALPLTDSQAVKARLEEVRNSMGKAGGIIHCAGAGYPESPAFIRKNIGRFENVLAPKVQGLDVLRSCFENEPLRFFVLFSSVSATVPSLASGQIDYAMANAYMDYVAEAAAGFSPLLSIQWPSWKESGSGEVRSRPYQEAGLVGLTDREGLEILDYLLAHRSGPVILPAMVDPAVWKPERLMRANPRESTAARAWMNTNPPAELSPFSAEPVPVPKPENLIEATQKWLTELLAQELKMAPERLDSEIPFQDYGVDSVLLAQFLGRINGKLAEALDPSTLYEYTDLASLSRRLVRTEDASLASWLCAPAESMRKSAVLPGDHADLPTVVPPPPDVPAATSTRTERIRPASVQPRSLDIAVIGMSCRFPGADCLDSYWDLLASGRSAIARVPAWRWGRPSHFYAGLTGTVTRFDPRFFLLPVEDVRAMDPQALLALEQSLELLCHAGYSVQDIKGTRTGVFLGARSRHQPAPLELDRARNPIVAVGQNYFASNISQFFDLRGPSMVVDTACSSALVAMNLAVQSLELGGIDSALVGGIGLLNDDSAHRMFEKRQLLSPEPSFHVFDGRASGVVLGEGAGFVMIKSLERALEDGDSIYAVIKGLAVNNDGRTAGPASPNLQAHKDVMQQALWQSGKRADEIRYIEANGSGSEVTDLLELKAIESVYRAASAAPCSLGSIKPNIGHPLSAEGIAGFIKLVLMLRKQQLVPFLSGQEPMQYYNIESSPFSFCRTLTPWTETPRLAVLNCFADGGTNVHVVLESWDGDASRAAPRQPLPLPDLEPIPMRDIAVPAGANGDSGHPSNPWWGSGAI